MYQQGLRILEFICCMVMIEFLLYFYKGYLLWTINPSLQSVRLCRYNYITEEGKILFPDIGAKWKLNFKISFWAVAQRQLIKHHLLLWNGFMKVLMLCCCIMEDWEMWVRIAANYSLWLLQWNSADIKYTYKFTSGKYFRRSEHSWFNQSNADTAVPACQREKEPRY